MTRGVAQEAGKGFALASERMGEGVPGATPTTLRGVSAGRGGAWGWNGGRGAGAGARMQQGGREGARGGHSGL